MLKKYHTKLLFLAILIISVFLIKIVYISSNIQEIKQDAEGDLVHHLQISKWFTGQSVSETDQTYQYPPLWSIIVIPALYVDTEAYVILQHIILGVLTIIPLTLILRRYTGFYHSGLISAFVVVINIIFSQSPFLLKNTYGNPIVLSAFLFAWFIYFFRDIHKNKKAYWMSSLFYMLLIATKYVFIFMLPFIITWMLMGRYTYFYTKIKSVIMWGIPSFLVVLIWSTRNMILHGYSVEGAMGGYHNVWTQGWLEIGSKLNTISTLRESNTMMSYYMVYILTMVMIFIYSKKHKDIIEKYYIREDRQFFYLLILNFAVFFFFPAMMYSRWCLSWRYLTYFTPVYLAIAILTATIFIREYLIQSISRKKEL